MIRSSRERASKSASMTVGSSTENSDSRGFDSSRFLIPRGGTPGSMGNSWKFRLRDSWFADAECAG